MTGTKRRTDRQIVRAKWTMDGAATLEQAAKQLEELAAYLRKRETQGWQLEEPVKDDYAFLVRHR